MKKIEAIIRPAKLEELKTALEAVGVRGMTVDDVKGRGLQCAEKQYYRGQEHSIDLFPKVKLEIVCQDESVENIISQIIKPARQARRAMERYLSIRWNGSSASAPGKKGALPCKKQGEFDTDKQRRLW